MTIIILTTIKSLIFFGLGVLFQTFRSRNIWVVDVSGDEKKYKKDID